MPWPFIRIHVDYSRVQTDTPSVWRTTGWQITLYTIPVTLYSRTNPNNFVYFKAVDHSNRLRSMATQRQINVQSIQDRGLLICGGSTESCCNQPNPLWSRLYQEFWTGVLGDPVRQHQLLLVCSVKCLWSGRHPSQILVSTLCGMYCRWALKYRDTPLAIRLTGWNKIKNKPTPVIHSSN